MLSTKALNTHWAKYCDFPLGHYLFTWANSISHRSILQNPISHSFQDNPCFFLGLVDIFIIYVTISCKAQFKTIWLNNTTLSIWHFHVKFSLLVLLETFLQLILKDNFWIVNKMVYSSLNWITFFSSSINE